MNAVLVFPVRPAAGGWRERAACRGEDPALFFPPKGHPNSNKAAKAICARCPVRAEWLEDALDNREGHGIRGGLTATERRPLLKGRPVLPVPRPACGTEAGYKRHERDHTRKCDGCLDAHRLYVASRVSA